MDCKHERLKSVNCKLYCAVCGAEMPTEALFAAKTNQNTPAEERPSESPKQAEKRTRKKKDE